MAQPTEDQKGSDREGLDAFSERFGNLKDRMEQEVHPDLERRELPTAEHPDRIQEREDAAAAEAEKQEHEIWPSRSSQQDFEAAANDQSRADDGEGVASGQVAQDAPEANLPPPRETENVDRQAHKERMSQDDFAARRPMTDQYYDERADRALEAQADRLANGQDRDRGQDFEHSR